MDIHGTLVFPPLSSTDPQTNRFKMISGTQKNYKEQILAPAKSVDRFAKKIDRSTDKNNRQIWFSGTL